MIRSMTGFGRASGEALGREVSVEVRTVNNRFRDVLVRLPKSLSMLEEDIKKIVAEFVQRGRVEVRIQVGEPTTPNKKLQLDLDLARTYHELLVQLNQELGLTSEPRLHDIVQLKDVIVFQEEELDLESFLAELAPVAREALVGLTAMREAEGASIREDFSARISRMAEWVKEISGFQENILVETRTRLEARIKTLTEGMDLDPIRLHQEAAILVDRSDITEELVRLGSHFEQFRSMLGSGKTMGKKLEFLMQEMNREVNTIGSKTQDVRVTNLVVDMKTELEKLREQVQNVE